MKERNERKECDSKAYKEKKERKKELKKERGKK